MSANSERKQVCEEVEALDRLRRSSGLVPGTVMRGADPPDFIVIEDDGRRIAVEMTRYHQESGPKGSPLAKQEALEDRVAAAAKKRFEREYPDVHVIVQPHFRPASFDLKTFSVIADRLARLVANVVPSEPTSARIDSRFATWDEISDAGLGEVLINLYVIRLSARYAAVQGNSWGRVSGIAGTDTDHLELVIRRKEKDLAGYRDAGIAEYWLIIYAAPGRASGFFDLEVLTPAMWKSDFDRVVFQDGYHYVPVV